MKEQDKIVAKSKKVLEELPNLSVEQLELLVRHHNHAYFDKNQPEITDEAFDRLVETLRFLDEDSLILQEIEGSAKGASKAVVVKHKRPMLSLDKCYDKESFAKWREKVEGDVIAMPKIDGVACSVHYDKKGQLSLAATRGNGKKGENITANVMQIADVPKILSKIGQEVEVRGEVYMKLSRFKKKYQADFANPRNLAAGALKLKDLKASALYGLSFFPYDIDGTSIKTEVEKFKYLAALGFTNPKVNQLSEIEDCEQAFATLLKQRGRIDFEVDGMVFRANQVSEQKRLGVTSHHPKWAMAYKFQGESAQTRLNGVVWSVARTGMITPVASVKPVFVSGASVSKASLHNLGMFLKLKLSKGALVEIVRRGGVIPHLERVISPGEQAHLLPPSQCPSCGGEVKKEKDFLKCQNPSTCLAVIRGRIEHFCAVLDIEGFGEKIITTLIQKGLVKTPADLFRLKAQELVSLERMGKVLASKLVQNAAEKRKLTLPVFLTALGIPEVGPTVAETLVEHYPTLSLLQKSNRKDLASLYGIGKAIATSLVEGLKKHSEEIEDILSEIEIISEDKESSELGSHPLFGKSFVFTGAMLHLERKEAQKQVRAVGGKTPASLSEKTNYLVVGDKEDSKGTKLSTKQKKAALLVKKGAALSVITESDFLKLLKRN